MDLVVYILAGAAVLLLIYMLSPLRKMRIQRRLLDRQTKQIEYQNKILEEQNTRLKELNEDKRQFMSVVTHDLKTPLNRVFALSNLVSMGADNLTKDQLDYLNRIHIVVIEGQSLLRNLLDIRALETHSIQLKIEPVKLDSLLASIKKSYSPVAQRKMIDLDFCTTNIEIQSDKHYLDRIFDNLISNALKYTAWESRVQVMVEQEDNNILFTVEDEGPGIDSREAENLFQKFSILSAKPTDGEATTGIGLYVVKSLLDKLGGTISFENKEGSGCVFSARIPGSGKN